MKSSTYATLGVAFLLVVGKMWGKTALDLRGRGFHGTSSPNGLAMLALSSDTSFGRRGTPGVKSMLSLIAGLACEPWTASDCG